MTAEAGQRIADRTIRLPKLNILAMQDALASAYLVRNQGLIPGKPIAEPFVYTTTRVRSPAPLHPTLAVSGVDIADLDASAPQKRTLAQHLTMLFETLLALNTQPDLSLQMVARYSYSLHKDLRPVTVPIALLPRAKVLVGPSGTTVGDDGIALAQLIADEARAIETWFRASSPSREQGRFTFDMTLLSNLTSEPLPLLNLDEMTLDLAYVQGI